MRPLINIIVFTGTLALVGFLVKLAIDNRENLTTRAVMIYGGTLLVLITVAVAILSLIL